MRDFEKYTRLNLCRYRAVMIKDIPLRMNNTPVRVNTEMEGLLSLAIIQNFVPVVDDSEIFIGRFIITIFSLRSLHLCGKTFLSLDLFLPQRRRGEF